MKKPLGILLIAGIYAAVAFGSGACLAQGKASATAAVTIVTPGTIDKESDLSIAIPLGFFNGYTGTGGRLRKLSSPTPEVTAASFNISGQPYYTYGLSVPQVLNIAEGGTGLSIATRVCTASSNAVLSAQGTDAISIDATVHKAPMVKGNVVGNARELAVIIVYN